MALVFEKNINLRTSDFNFNDKLKHHSLLDIFQDFAGAHATKLGIGYEFCKERNLIWVLVSNKVKILSNPKLEEEVLVRTWPQEKGRIDFIRDYEIETLDGIVIAKCRSRWVVVNSITRKIERTTSLNYDGEIYDRSTFVDIEKIRVSIPHTKAYLGSHKVLKNDLDHNGHMNNSKYIEIVYNLVDIPQNITLSIDYINEAVLDESIDLFSFEEKNIKYIVGYIGLKECFIMKMEE